MFTFKHYPVIIVPKYFTKYWKIKLNKCYGMFNQQFVVLNKGV